MYFGPEAHHPEAVERQALAEERAICIPHEGIFLSGSLCIPPSAHATVLIANDAGSARHLAPLRAIAQKLRAHGFATLMVDMLQLEEESACATVQASRIDSARAWLATKEVGALPLVLFGMGLAAPAALISAAVRPRQVQAVIACGPFPSYAGIAPENLKVPALFIARTGALEIAQAALAFLDRESCHLRIAG